MKTCLTCGMPLNNKEDFAQEDENSEYCRYCVNPDGSLKSVEEIFLGGVEYFLQVLGGERGMAEKITRKNMNLLSYWAGKDIEILKGEMASDEEFAAALKKL